MNKKLEDTFDLPNIEDMIAEQESAEENQQETSEKEKIEAVEETVEHQQLKKLIMHYRKLKI